MSAPHSLLFIPGWGADARIWSGLPEELSTPAQTIGWQTVLEDPEATRRVLYAPAERRIIVGWSLGALLALRAAIDFPDRVAGLVLVSGTARMCADRGYPGADPRALRAMRLRLTQAPARVLAEFAVRCAAPRNDAAVTEYYAQQVALFSPTVLGMGLEALATLDVREQAEIVRIPVHLLHGSEDAIVPLASAEDLAQRIPGAHIERIAGHGHALPFTAPQIIARSIRTLIAS